MQAITATPESLAITNNIDPITGVPTLYLNIGLQNGLFLKTVVDSVTGVLSDSRLRFLGSRPVKLFKVQVGGGDAVLALSSRPWLSFHHAGRAKLLPLSYEFLEYGSSFCTEQCLEGIVAISGNTLRILSVDKLDGVFNQTCIPLQYTPRKQVIHPNNRFFIIIESDNNTLSAEERAQGLRKTSTAMDISEEDGVNGTAVEELPMEQFGLPAAGVGRWASCVRVVNPVDGTTVDLHDLDDNEAAFR
jgi:splicing factor 3B subunit 3